MPSEYPVWLDFWVPRGQIIPHARIVVTSVEVDEVQARIGELGCGLGMSCARTLPFPKPREADAGFRKAPIVLSLRHIRHVAIVGGHFLPRINKISRESADRDRMTSE